MLEIVKTKIEIGLDRPVKLLHVTDTHISDTDERDDEIKRRICRGSDAEAIRRHFRAAIEYCNENCDMMAHTGDLISVVSPRSLEVVREHLDMCKNHLIIAGNHEFSQGCGESWEDVSYKMTAYPMVRHILGEDILFSSKIVGGVNVVGVDDSYYRVEPWQLWRLQQEVKKGLPIVLMMHVPLFDPGLYEASRNFWGYNVYLMGCEEKLLRPFGEFRMVQQLLTDDTKRFIDYVYSEPLIKCVLAGHVHFNYECTLPSGIPQLVTALNFEGNAREITLC